MVRLASKRLGFLLFAMTWSVSVVLPIGASAYFSSGCIANISPSTMDVGTASDFDISLTNASFSDVQWVDINVPSAAYTYAGNSISSWSTADHDGGTTATGSAINGQQTQDFIVTVVAGLQGTSPENWVVRTSTDPSGSNPITCTGSLSTSIVGHLPQDNVNGVSNISVTNVTQNSATINWQSDNPSTSLIYYGLDSNYGSTSSFDSNLSSDHSMGLTGLSANTTYHFQVVGTDTNGSYAYSIDNTFVTTAAPVVTPPPSITNKPVTKVTRAPTAGPKDTNAPKVSVGTKLAGSYKDAPTISGTASDDQKVSIVEYSTDGGLNWLPVDSLNGADTKDASFSFTPAVTLDGDYKIVVRAFDSSSNVTSGETQTLVIDRLPPIVGGVVTSLGAQMIQPDNNGVVRALVGNDQKVTMSAIGGATSVVVDATQVGRKNSIQSFSLTNSSDTGLWSGSLNFQHAGTFKLSVRALDGAGNTTTRELNTIIAELPSTIIDHSTHKPLGGASVDVYYRDPETQTWVKWDATSYNQTNPLTVPANGQYGLYLPGGTYYLKASAGGYVSTMTKSFTLKEPTIISTSIQLKHKPTLNAGPLHITLPWFSLDQVSVNTSSQQLPSKTPSVVSQSVPDFKAEQTDGSTVTLSKLYGKPTIMSFVATWSPASQDQLSVLSKLNNEGINVVAVDSGESKSKLKSYASISGYSLPVLIDSDNKLINGMGVAGLPTTYFIDRHGVVKKVMVGVLSKEELLNYVSSGL